MLDEWRTSVVVQTVALVVTVTAVWRCVRWWVSYRSYFVFFNSLPGETDFSWIWGNLHTIRGMGTEDMLRYMEKLTAQYPKFFRSWYGPFKPMVTLHHPDTMRPLLKIDGPKTWSYDQMIPWVGEGLLISKGPKWQRSRRLLTPAFHFDILKPYGDVSNQACDVLLQKISKSASEKKSIEMFSMISQCTLDVILQCAMSYKADIQTRGEDHPYVQAVSGLSELNYKRYENPLVDWDWLYALTPNGREYRRLCDFVHSISDHIIRTRQQILEREGPPKKRYLDFLDILLTAKDNTGQGLSPLEIRSEVDTFMFAGHDTTASAISWTLYSLCQHQEHQRHVQQEVDTVLQGRDCDDITWEDLSKLEFLTAVIKEAMRVHCPVFDIGRILTEPLTVEGVRLPEGTTCHVNIYNLHHHPDLWIQPDLFRPDRFLPENCVGRDHYAFLPFSAGPRNCIGQHFAMNELKVILARLLRRFTFHLDPSHKVVKKLAIIMRTENGMKMFAEPRTVPV